MSVGSDSSRGQRWLRGLSRVWRDAIPLLALVLAFLAIQGTQSHLERQREGRAVAIDVLCGGLRGVEDAGVATLKDELPGTPRRAQSRAEARLRARAARSYARIISQSVVDQSGLTLASVLEPDGRLNCDKLIILASANREK